MRVIGTAGHVDHGKSTLIAALTGTHPDRLKEEQEREMTIDLGFGWLTLPNGEEVGIVDVPGHRDFIENMLSGIAGLDAALLVIAADEGVMPQTREHLAILDVLQIPAGLIVLTKIDLAPDETWLDLIEADIRLAIADTILKDAPILRVSAKTKHGLEALLSSLQSLLEQKPSRPDLNRPRLPIDRVFSISGFGTVVTGTLSDGHLSVGEDVEILPSGQRGRVRGLQTHKKKEEVAVPGSRTAVNISGVETESIRRGDVVTHPGQYSSTRRIDARLRVLKDVSAAVKHNSEVKCFVGASETIAMLRVLSIDELKPGEEGWIQLELRAPIVAVRGDRYILRRPSPGETLGGGAILDAQPKGRHKRFDEAVLKSLEALSQGTPTEILYESALALNTAPIQDIVNHSRLDSTSAETALHELLLANSLIALEQGPLNITSEVLVMALPHWKNLQDKTLQIVDSYHQNFQLRRGIPREELKNKLKLSPRMFNVFISALLVRHRLLEFGNLLAMPQHKVSLDSKQQAQVRELMQRFEENPFSPPTVKECQAVVGEEILNALIDQRELILVSADVIFRKQDYDSAVTTIRTALHKKETITLAEVRDLLNTSRKYAQALLEHLDGMGITIRDGDSRKLKKK